ncbi:alkaline phosphatase D family protein [Flavobacterium sp. CHNK8]|uniref:alkaline phosphatase D family protein n=1 Tax=Flavobacterium sp. CHNK8 TaxID=2871165 RepID=UPI001C8F0C3C|nr:alkaline phosphatase D family protein [Flavobacterium sp. CHNK8]QZK89218.1 alkaline phosphatase D family protein [Flavobacterium sp. CHNK8]
MKSNFSRRAFLKNSLLFSGGVLLAPNFISCSKDDEPINQAPTDLKLSNFNEGVASFDPTATSIILWTRYTASKSGSVNLSWEISTDAKFSQVLRQGKVVTDETRDFTIAVDVQGLPSNKSFYYRFYNVMTKEVSVIGETITLPSSSDTISQVRMAVCSCANFAAGLFNVYEAMAKSDVDVIVHLGDYIYEYGAGEYGTNQYTSSLGRTHVPAKEIITLDDYRARYKQYRKDEKLKLAHQKKPFIAVWDDHEITNDTYKDGAQNHQPNEGDFSARKLAALKAYSEYIPLKTGNDSRIYRDFHFGNLLSLYMLDTRVIARDKQLEYATYFSSNGSFNATAFQTDLLNPSRQLLGTEQLGWLGSKIASSTSKWQVLGQQVLMTKMMLPSELLMLMAQINGEIDALGSAQPATLQAFQTSVGGLVTIKSRILANDPTVSAADKLRLSTVLPYNLDAWDGYPVEREKLFALLNGKKMVTLAGDTHNAWQGELKSSSNKAVGLELATSSVTSPGLETYLGLGGTQLAQFEQALNLLIDDLEYSNLSKRGYLKATFSASDVKAEWFFATSVFVEGATVNLEKTITKS